MNKIFNRPLSPHITIYSLQLSSLLSIWHRISGVLLTIIFFLSLHFLKFNTLRISSTINFYFFTSYYLIFYFMYFLISLLFLYHFINGFRHILWDFGLFLTSKYVFTSSILIILFLITFQTLFIKILIY
uniref:Succinate dehydrogenase subunit 3 n=1 Tax=Sheathia arcuata TaxID=340433 RepID=A0A1Z1XA78_9FLOR|nr:succinate dehydrogenase subunit 3 [Sheathia arcuata]ARX95751.1 succinate dehydrogenase subunit 3 [Sheathia arcuata]